MSRTVSNILCLAAFVMIIAIAFFMPSESEAMKQCKKTYSDSRCVKMIYGG